MGDVVQPLINQLHSFNPDQVSDGPGFAAVHTVSQQPLSRSPPDSDPVCQRTRICLSADWETCLQDWDKLSSDDIDAWEPTGPSTPLLDTVSFPVHMKNFSTPQLRQLCLEIRKARRSPSPNNTMVWMRTTAYFAHACLFRGVHGRSMLKQVGGTLHDAGVVALVSSHLWGPRPFSLHQALIWLLSWRRISFTP